MERVGDLTLADFWGLGKTIPFKGDPSHGCSLIFVNTDKGSKLLQEVRDRIFLEERPVEEAVEGNGQLRRPMQRPPMRDEFYHLDWETIAPRINYGKPFPFRRALRACKRALLNMLGGNGK